MPHIRGVVLQCRHCHASGHQRRFAYSRLVDERDSQLDSSRGRNAPSAACGRRTTRVSGAGPIPFRAGISRHSLWASKGRHSEVRGDRDRVERPPMDTRREWRIGLRLRLPGALSPGASARLNRADTAPMRLGDSGASRRMEWQCAAPRHAPQSPSTLLASSFKLAQIS